MVDWNICSPIDFYLEDENGANGAEDFLETPRMEPGYISVITNITAVDYTTQCSASLTVGYVSGGVFHPLKAAQPAAELTVDWQGEIALREGDYVQARFKNTTNGDDIFLQVNGYKVPVG
jgi:deoxyribodipyrimidine photolyase